MAVRQIQSTFTLGELDPKLVARTDFEGYYKGAKKLRNVLVIPQGGLKRRFGLTYVATVVDTGDANEPITTDSEVNGCVFDFSPSKPFLIIARPNDRTGVPGVGFDIYLNDVLQTTVTTTLYTIAQIPDLYFVRAQDRVIILHESVQPTQLVRGANDATWTLTSITFSYYPVYDFSIPDGVTYRGAADTFTPAATSGVGINLTGSSAFFTAGHVGGLFIGGGGIFRITAVNAGGTIATGDTINDFTGTAAIKGVNAVLLSAAWGDYSAGTPAGKNRGWPSKGCFFQNRLILANSSSLPNLLWASNSGDYYNFDDSEGLDLDGFSLGLGSDGNEEIQDIVGSKGLVALGLNGIYSTSLFIDQPITPGNAFLNEQAKDGSANRRAQVIDNQIFFVDENLQQIKAAQYDISTSSFSLLDATLLSPQIIDNPVSTASYRPNSNDGSFYLATNEDGTLGSFQSLISQNVQAWTLLSTCGDFEKVFSSRDAAFILTRRSLNTGATITGFAQNYYTCNEDFEGFTDVTASCIDAATDATLFSTEGDYLLIGHECPFDRIAVALNTAASATITPVFEYLDSTGDWVTFAPTDGTTGFTLAGNITWSLDTDTPDWFPNILTDVLPLDSVTGYERKFWMRIQRTAVTVNTLPIEDTIKINVLNRLHIEKIDFSQYMDAAESTTSDANGLVTGLDHLKGQQVYALVNKIPEGPFFVDSSGEITVSEQSSNVKVGINYIPELIPMPLVAQFAFMQSVYQPKHLKSIYIDYYESLGILVNGFEIPSLALNQLILDEEPRPVTDFYEIAPMRGWDPRKDNVISQELPLPMTILGIGYRLEVS